MVFTGGLTDLDGPVGPPPLLPDDTSPLLTRPVFVFTHPRPRPRRLLNDILGPGQGMGETRGRKSGYFPSTETSISKDDWVPKVFGSLLDLKSSCHGEPLLWT